MLSTSPFGNSSRAQGRATSEPPQSAASSSSSPSPALTISPTPRPRAAVHCAPRSCSPSPSTSGFSIIGADEIDETDLFFRTGTYRSMGGFNKRAAMYSAPALGYFSSQPPPHNPLPTSQSPISSIKTFLPRLWDVLVSTPSKAAFLPHPSGGSSKRHSVYGYSTSSSPLKKGKGKAHRDFNHSECEHPVDYSCLAPLDGEEGELVDDEACFVATDYWGLNVTAPCNRATVVTGIDIISLLPPELSLHIFQLLSSPLLPNSFVSSSTLTMTFPESQHDPLSDLLCAASVSQTWRRLANDNTVWRELFISRWGALDYSKMAKIARTSHMQVSPSGESRCARPISQRRITMDSDLLQGTRHKKLPALPPHGQEVLEEVFPTPSRLSSTSTLPSINWFRIYRDRLIVEQRWNSSKTDQWSPSPLQISGHADSVYCLEFTSTHIFTGSRDRTIKVWSMKTGKCLGTFGKAGHAESDDFLPQGHNGSVLCLKFFWDDPHAVEDLIEQVRSGNSANGILFSGSSDCTICVWDLSLVPAPRRHHHRAPWEAAEPRVEAQVKAVLRGHGGGVLDLRVDDQWIVSCSKDAVIRVWDRQNFELCQTFKGHEGPVNAVGLEDGRIVSASGDGKMILWDIKSGNRIRTFDGHDRGLACIEFKAGLIVSGSNDCKIKIWSATTGECLRTLVGHEALVRALAFDPKSGRLVSASYDKSVRVWDVMSGKMLQEFRDSHTSHIFDVKFDLLRIVSTSHDQKIVVLDFSKGIKTAGLFV